MERARAIEVLQALLLEELEENEESDSIPALELAISELECLEEIEDLGEEEA